MPGSKDKRIFKRYKISTEISIFSSDNSWTAYTTDYSLKGVGFYIDAPPPLTVGPDVRFSIKDLNLDENVKIVWSRHSKNRLKGGIERKGISGQLKNYHISDILMDLQRSLKNGIFDITYRNIIKRIYIKTGDMVYATSNAEEDRFIEVLLNTGRINLDQYYQVVNLSQKKGKSYGSVLVELNYLKPDDLTAAVKLQVEQIILSLFNWEEGNFSFIEGPVVPENMIKLKFSTADLIYRGVKEIKNLSMLKKLLPQKSSVLFYSTDPIDLFQDLRLDNSDREILHRIDGQKNIGDIVSESGKDTFQTLKILYALLNTRIINVREDNEPPENIPLEGELLKENISVADAEFMQKVENLFKKLEYIDHYSFLGVPKWATIDKIKKAYYTSAKEFHPDRHLSVTSETLKMQLNSIFAHLTEVYKVLSNPDERKSYDESLSVKPARLHTGNAEIARLKFLEGEEAYRKEAYTEARELFGQAVYLDSSVAAYHYNLGLAFDREKQFQAAVKSLSQAVKLEPFNAEYLAELGHLYLKLGFNLRAQSTFEKALKLKSSCKRAAEGIHILSHKKDR